MKAKAMMTRIIETAYDRNRLLKYLELQDGAVTVTITKGKHRSTRQNRLQRQWINELSEQMGQSTEDVRALLKLKYAVPILRNENEAFAKEYDKVIAPLPYLSKISLMKVPLDWPVTRRMTTKQYNAFLDEVYREFSEKGFVLTDPDDQKWA